ncbi:LemA family protein, partial [Burkholderia pseudomallei]
MRVHSSAPRAGAPRFRLIRAAVLAALALTLSGCAYNPIQVQDAHVNARCTEELNQYQRRADLVPN